MQEDRLGKERNIISINHELVESHLTLSSKEYRPNTAAIEQAFVPIAVTPGHAYSCLEHATAESLISDSTNTTNFVTTSQFIRTKSPPSRIKSRRVLRKIDESLD